MASARKVTSSDEPPAENSGGIDHVIGRPGFGVRVESFLNFAVTQSVH
jgi:hypothetical protein